MPQFKRKIHKRKIDKKFNCIPCQNNQNRKETAMNHITEGALGASAIRKPPEQPTTPGVTLELAVPYACSFVLLGYHIS